MELINFLEDRVLNSFRSAMRAPLSKYKMKIELPAPIFKSRPSSDFVAPIPTVGLDVELDEIGVYKDGTLTYKNKRVLVHIRDASHHTPRFHLVNCVTLLEMKSTGRFERYVVSESDDGYFYVRIDGKSLLRYKLPVCQNCLDRLEWNGFGIESLSSASRKLIVQNFSIKDFFAKYPISLHPIVPAHTVDTAPLNDYPENWTDIANKLKHQLGYHCQYCQLILGVQYKKFLHVHHLNGVKSDCRPENLMCLCISCHADQPLHQSIKQTPDYLEFKRLFP